MRSRALRGQEAQSGVTLLELLAVMALIGIITAMAVPPLRRFELSQRLASATRDAVSMLRHAQGNSVANATTAKVSVAAGGKSLIEYLKDANGNYQQVGKVPFPSRVSVTSYSFTARTGGASTDMYFFPRGTATPGTMVIALDSGTAHTITIEGVTGRVAYS